MLLTSLVLVTQGHCYLHDRQSAIKLPIEYAITVLTTVHK